MIQFKHYHDHKGGYVDALSKGYTAEDKRTFQTISAFKRTQEKETCFTYLPKDGIAYLLQATKDGIYEYCHGLAREISDFKETRVVEYIDQLEKEYKSGADADGTLPEGKLPLRCKEFGLSLAKGLNPVFAEIIDALVYGSKPVVLVGNDTKDLIKYVKVTMCLLPPAYANSIGFSVCPAELPSFFASGTSVATDSIRLVATDKKIPSGETRKVIDVDEPQVVTGEMGAYAEVIRGVSDLLVSGAGERLNNLVRSVCPSFHSDGTVDKNQLDTAISVYNFDSNRNAENAIAVLKAYQADPASVITRFTLVDAVDVLFKKDALAADEEKLIESVRADSETNDLIKETAGRYAFGKLVSGKTISPMQLNDATEFVMALDDKSISAEGEVFAPAFAIRRNTSMLSLIARAYAETKKPAFLALVSSYTDILKTYNYTQQDGEDFDAAILDVATNCSTAEAELIAAVILSCYALDVISVNGAKAKTKQRIAALEKLLDRRKPDAKERIKYILRIKAALETVADSVGREVRGPDDFEFLQSEYLKKLVGSIEFDSLLALANEADVDFSFYSMLEAEILEKLSNYDIVEKYVTAESNIEEYELFLERYEHVLNSRNLDGGVDSIREHISQLKDSIDLRRSILAYRCNFVVGEYDAFPQAAKQKVANKASGSGKNYVVKGSAGRGNEKDDIKDVFNRKDDETSDSIDEKQKIAEHISKTVRELGPGGVGRTSTLNAKAFCVSCIWALVFVLISMSLFVAIPIATAIVLGTDPMARAQNFIKFYHIIVLIYIAALNIFGYFLRWAYSNHDRKASLRKACISTILWGIVPVALYAVMYIVTYFVL